MARKRIEEPPLESLLMERAQQAVRVIKEHPVAEAVGTWIARDLANWAEKGRPADVNSDMFQVYFNALQGASKSQTVVRDALVAFGVAFLRHRDERACAPESDVVYKVVGQCMLIASTSPELCRILAGTSGQRGRPAGANDARNAWITWRFDRLRQDGTSYENAVAAISADLVGDGGDAEKLVRDVVDRWCQARKRDLYAVKRADELHAEGIRPGWTPPRRRR